MEEGTQIEFGWLCRDQRLHRGVRYAAPALRSVAASGAAAMSLSIVHSPIRRCRRRSARSLSVATVAVVIVAVVMAEYLVGGLLCLNRRRIHPEHIEMMAVRTTETPPIHGPVILRRHRRRTTSRQRLLHQHVHLRAALGRQSVQRLAVSRHVAWLRVESDVFEAFDSTCLRRSSLRSRLRCQDQ